jgi:2-C-methyl-D-erythritol 2,4-cyclodiphosphate synthase
MTLYSDTKEKKLVMTRIGLGYDIHRLEPGRKLVLGGETIPFEKGLSGHSDADVLVHAACDAPVGRNRDGRHRGPFPRYRSPVSGCLQHRVVDIRLPPGAKGWIALVNMDATVFAQAPRLSPYKSRMAMRMADSMSVDHRIINIKATTTEGLGAIGKGDGIAAMCVVLLQSTNAVETGK